ncbi:hypothetical protein C2S51_019327 [Perilla frutescens var. frutescens]|nr:hypothetical protein C2S51_019327 [Perilla frutescens var. frutescens]
MSPSILSFPTSIFLTSSIIVVLISTSISPVQCRQPSPPVPRLIQRACSNAHITINTELCLRVLPTIPKVVAARDSFHLTTAIIESGISNASATLRYIEALLYEGGDSVDSDLGSGEYNAVAQCKWSFVDIISRFSKALKQIRRHNYEFKATSYQLQTASTDYVRTCATGLAEVKFDDQSLLEGVNVVPIFGISAISIIRDLHNHDSSHRVEA